MIISEEAIGMDMIEFFDYASEFLELARKDHEEGNFYGEGQMLRQYEWLVDDGLGFWNITYARALELGLIEEVNFQKEDKKMTKEKELQKIQSFLWDAFCDPDATGVYLNDLLTWPGLHLTSDQVTSAEYHFYDPEAWDEGNEAVRDVVANNTDCEDFNRLYCWLIWAVGDRTAFDLVKSWAEN